MTSSELSYIVSRCPMLIVVLGTEVTKHCAEIQCERNPAGLAQVAENTTIWKAMGYKKQ